VTSPIGKILEWLKAGYPQGIPPNDYPPVLGVLRRNMSEEEIVSISDELAMQSVSGGDVPVTAEQIRDMVRSMAFQKATPEDIQRVSANLAKGGWPLASELTD
jgi:uncharacterized protein (DUF2267 family)